MPKQGPKDDSPAKSFISGGVGGLCGGLVGHPMDTIKVRLQTMPAPQGAGESPLYKGTLDCAVKIVKNDGITALYKGFATPVCMSIPTSAVILLGVSVGKRLQKPTNKEGCQKLTFLQHFNAGALAGVFVTPVMAPGERVKCLLQVQQTAASGEGGGGAVGNKLYSGPIDCVGKLYREGGVRSVFRGMGATLLRNIPAFGVYFWTYEWVTHILCPLDPTDFCVWRIMVSGGCAGVLSCAVSMPADVVKSRLQVTHADSYPGGIRDVVREVLREEGVRAMYRGFTPIVIRAFPMNAAFFLGVEFSLSCLNDVPLHL